jgi:hypothetical protein
VNESDVAERNEAFVRQAFTVAAGDPRFGRETDLFEEGYVDSVGLSSSLPSSRTSSGSRRRTMTWCRMSS